MTDFNPYQFQLDDLQRRIAASKELLQDPEMAELATQELQELEKEQKMLEEATQSYQNAGESADSTASGDGKFVNCIMEIRQGAGGDEAKIWANDLMRMYMRYIETTTLTVEVIDELVMKIKGRMTVAEGAPEATVLTAYDLFQYESGVHRVQRVPATEAQG